MRKMLQQVQQAGTARAAAHPARLAVGLVIELGGLICLATQIRHLG